MAYLKLDGLKQLKDFLCNIYLHFFVILQTGHNGQQGLKESRGVCAADAEALHIHTRCLQ